MGINRKEEHRIWRGLNHKTKIGVKEMLDNVIFEDGRAFNTETGEEITHLVDVGIKTTDKQIRRLQETDELSRHQSDNGGFIFALFKQSTSIKERFSSLNKQDIARLMYLATFISWEGNRLQADNGRKVYVKSDLADLFNMSTKRFNEFYRKLKNEDIIQESEDKGEITVNPSLFYRGEFTNYDYDISEYQYTRLFRKTVRDLYYQFNGRTLGQLSNIYAILPFVNFDTNIICHNPSGTSEDLIKPITVAELSEILGYGNPSKLKTALNNVKVYGKPVFGFFENPNDRRQLRIVVNPRVVFAGNGESLRGIKTLFN